MDIVIISYNYYRGVRCIEGDNYIGNIPKSIKSI